MSVNNWQSDTILITVNIRRSDNNPYPPMPVPWAHQLTPHSWSLYPYYHHLSLPGQCVEPFRRCNTKANRRLTQARSETSSSYYASTQTCLTLSTCQFPKQPTVVSLNILSHLHIIPSTLHDPQMFLKNIYIAPSFFPPFRTCQIQTMEGSKQPSVEDMIAVVEAGHRHLVEDLKNNHNHMMTTVENHHNHLVNGLRYDLVIASNRRNMLTTFLAGAFRRPHPLDPQKAEGKSTSALRPTIPRPQRWPCEAKLLLGGAPV